MKANIEPLKFGLFSISLNISQTFSEIIALKGKGVQLTNGKIIPDTPHKGENVTTLQ